MRTLSRVCLEDWRWRTGGIDASLGTLEFEREMVERATEWLIDGCQPVRIGCAADLVVTKAFAGRDRDWSDIGGVVVRQGVALNRAAILPRLEPLAQFAERPESISRLR